VIAALVIAALVIAALISSLGLFPVAGCRSSAAASRSSFGPRRKHGGTDDDVDATR
jgi:hypothetical protein